jgi:hypothetical protein
MEIELINSMGRYTQKSNTFLYPLLNLTVNPIETYLKFDNIDLSDERFLIALYWTEDKNYLKHKLDILNNKYFDNIFFDDVFAIVIFNMYSLRNEYDKIIKGEYSKVSKNCKAIVADQTTDPVIIKCMNPNNNYKEFATALGVDSEMLKGKELLSPPQDKAEVLNVNKTIKQEIIDTYL